eukprot:GHVR01085106.1.p1 GENE.GHVR01085106.1~~GHVR01085106.1.p1  ORF type:complete len:210 (+),score=53.03 GHVR01085106.1:50-679(+)
MYEKEATVDHDEHAATKKVAVIGGAVISGAAIGGGVAVPAVTAAISGIGFTSSGIAAGSTAAAMMAAEAVASGVGAVASGGSVAVLQSVGAAGLSAMSVAAITVSGVALGAGVLGCSVAAIYPLLRSGRKDGGYGGKVPGLWTVATEEGCHNVKTYTYATEKEARDVFHSLWMAKMLYNADGEEVAAGGCNPFGWPVNTIRRVVKERAC